MMINHFRISEKDYNINISIVNFFNNLTIATRSRTYRYERCIVGATLERCLAEVSRHVDLGVAVSHAFEKPIETIAADAAGFARDHMSKPVLGYIAGLTAPKGRRMGHAGAIVSASGESAAEKVEILRDCGVAVIERPSEFAEGVQSVLAKAS